MKNILHYIRLHTAAASVLLILLCLARTSAQDPSPAVPPSPSRTAPHKAPMAYVISASEKYRKMEKNLFVLNIGAALSDPQRAVAALIPVYSRIMAFSPDGQFCVSGNERDSIMTVIDTKKAVRDPSGSIVGSIKLQAPPSCMTVSTGRTVFVIENRGTKLEIFDMGKDPVNPGAAEYALTYSARAMALSPDDRYLVIKEKKIHILDTEKLLTDPQRAEVAAMMPGLPVSTMLFDRKGSFLYLSDLSKVVLSVVDFSRALLEPSKSEIMRGRAALLPEEHITAKDDEPLQTTMAALPGSDFMVMVHPSLNRMSVIDEAKIHRQEAQWGLSRIPTGRLPLHAAITADGSMILVNNYLSGNIFIFSAEKALADPERALLGKIPMPSPSFLLAKPE